MPPPLVHAAGHGVPSGGASAGAESGGASGIVASLGPSPGGCDSIRMTSCWTTSSCTAASAGPRPDGLRLHAAPTAAPPLAIATASAVGSLHPARMS